MAGNLLSSPDPLALSNENIPTRSSTKPRGVILTPRKALSNTSGNTHVQDFYLTPPPAKTSTLTKSAKHTAHSTSPWRIRLTVHADQLHTMEDAPPMKETPTNRLAERITTITVPLKGGDDTLPAEEKRIRGKSGKSMDAPVRMGGTPNPRKNARRRRVPEASGEDDDNVGVGKATPPKKARGRPRKTLEPMMHIPHSKGTDAFLHTLDIDGMDHDAVTRQTSRRKSRARKKEITPVKNAVDSNANGLNTLGSAERSLNEATGQTVGESLCGRNPCPDDNPLQQSDASASRGGNGSRNGELSPERSILNLHNEDIWRAMVLPQSQSFANSNEEQEHQVDFDPTNEHQDYDTILESEGFSMVTVSSLASTGNRFVSPTKQSRDLVAREHAPETASSSVPELLQHTQLQSDNKEKLQTRECTPALAASPSTPPLLLNDHLQSRLPSEKIKNGTPKLARIVRAGIALQGVLSPKEQKLGSPFRPSHGSSSDSVGDNATSSCEHSSPVTHARSPRDRLDNIFSGFGAGTRRELKSGLRLGEELAKRQRLVLKKAERDYKAQNDVFSGVVIPEFSSLVSSDSKPKYSLNVPQSGKGLGYPVLSNTQLPSPKSSEEGSDEDRMSWKADTSVEPNVPFIAETQGNRPEDPLIEYPKITMPLADQTAATDTQSIDYTMFSREAEWQRERQAVSRQIDMASKSQVIVIGSDDEDEDQQGQEGMSQEGQRAQGDDDDASGIRQAEASQSWEPTPDGIGILLQPELVKPRRSKLPSPWTRNSQMVYSDEAEPLGADLFWQPDKAKEKASKLPSSSEIRLEGQRDDPTGALLERELDPISDTDDEKHPNRLFQARLSEGVARSNSNLEDGQSSMHKPIDLPTTPGQTYTKDYSEVFDADTTFTQVGDQTLDALPMPPLMATGPRTVNPLLTSASLSPDEYTVDSLPASPEVDSPPIDPILLQEQTQKQCHRLSHGPVSAFVPLNSSLTQSSWLSRLAAPISKLFTSLPPPATIEDILSSSHYEPLCQFTPWEDCHFRALGPLFYASLCYGSHIFPFNRCSISSAYLGMKVVTAGGWCRNINEADCGIADAFMVILDKRGFVLGGEGERWIDEGLVVTMCVVLWMGMVMRGDLEIDASKGEKAGLREEGDRLWTKADIDWSKNKSQYLERKKREFDGLPSWKEKGIKWR